MDKFRSAKTQSAALKQFMPRRSRDYSTPSSSVSREQSLPRKEPSGGGAQAPRPTPNALSSLKSVTATLRGLVCRSSSPSFLLGLAVGGRVCLSPSTARPFAASGSASAAGFSPAVYGTHAGHPSVQHFSLHHPEQGRRWLSFTVEGAAASRPSRHPISGMSSLARHSASSIALLL